MVFSWIVGPIGQVWIGIRHRLSRPDKAMPRLVTLPTHGTLQVDILMDFVGDNCLRTILITKLTLNKAAAGTVLEICSDNLSAAETIPFMLHNCNCEHLATLNTPSCQKIYVRKSEAGPPATNQARATSANNSGRKSRK